jgi:hypothetical protein
MRRTLLLALSLVAACGFAGSASAQRSELPSTRLTPEVVATQLSTALDSRLAQVALAVRKSGLGAALDKARAEGLLVTQGKVRVIVHARTGRLVGARTAIRLAHGNLVTTSGRLIEALVPAKTLRQLASNPFVASVVPVSSAPWMTPTPGLPIAGAEAPAISVTLGMVPAELASATSVPGAPTDVIAEAGDGQAVVSFTAPASDGGDAVLYYTATAYPGGQSASGTGTTIVVGGLTNGTGYAFTVTATSNVGTGVESDPSNTVTPDGPSRLDPDEPPPARPRPGVPAFSPRGPRPSPHQNPGGEF